jgi:GNAT superfamily N-acetyltransferase
MQLEGLFDLPPTKSSSVSWSVELPLDERDWKIGLVVGPSGCGKTTLARELFGAAMAGGFDWPNDRSLVDAFPADLPIQEVTALLSSVGFSSPPSWLRPFAVLSNGEQFRATLARALAERRDLAVIDEFTSVVDRTVAKAASFAVGKAVRSRSGRFVAVGCHYDVIDWLQPDWTFEPAVGQFQWRELRRRPEIRMEIRRASRTAWTAFKGHHYLTSELHRSAQCFVGCIDGRPAGLAAMLPFPHPTRPGWREHRVVCLPDFQGMGIGNALSDYVCSLYRASGKPVRSVTSSPAMIHRRARSPLWKMTRPPSMLPAQFAARGKRSGSSNRFTASFEYVGPARPQDAEFFGIVAGDRSAGISREASSPTASVLQRPVPGRRAAPRSGRRAGGRRPVRPAGP